MDLDIFIHVGFSGAHKVPSEGALEMVLLQEWVMHCCMAG